MLRNEMLTSKEVDNLILEASSKETAIMVSANISVKTGAILMTFFICLMLFHRALSFKTLI